MRVINLWKNAPGGRGHLDHMQRAHLKRGGQVANGDVEAVERTGWEDQ